MAVLEEILTLIVPVYNESSSLKQLVPEILVACEAHAWRVIFINDGSRDDSGAILEELAGASKWATVLHHKLNRGYGGAIKTGIRHTNTQYLLTLDADGQHDLGNVSRILQFALEKQADMVVGNRGKLGDANAYRALGKKIIRIFTQMMMPLPIADLNSGFKLYRTDLAQKYIPLCPNSMSYSDVITLIFINQRNLVLEQDITIHPRKSGASTINTFTAFETVLEILNIILLFNPLHVFLPISVFFVLIGLAWGTGIYIVVGRGVSVGAMLAVVTGLIFFVLGLLANQISSMRMEKLE